MLKGNFELLICSPIDREKLTCEIYYLGEMLAEISQETDELLLEIYPPKTKKWWDIPLLQFQQIIEDAKNHLSGNLKT
jgi:hypothetical protein